jgi:hypothetical protein
MLEPGEAKNWDIQISAPFDFDTPRTMMIVDLWDSVPMATPLTYSDGSSAISVPQGARSSTISTLEAKDTVVICRVGLGGVNTSDPDFSKFPTAAVGTVATPFDANDRYLDLSMRDAWSVFAFAHVKLAKDIGCDGIEPYLVDHDTNDTGFTTNPADLIAWAKSVAQEAHAQELSVGLRNGTSVPSHVDSLDVDFDWHLVERCGEFQECDQPKVFLDARKAVFTIEYTTSVSGATQDTGPLCTAEIQNNLRDGIVKDVALTSARTSCE